MTPFTDRRRCSSSDGQSALSISKSVHLCKNRAEDLRKFYWFVILCVSGSEPEMRMSSTNAQLTTSSNYATFSTPKPTQCTTVPSTAELYRTLRLMPDGRYDCFIENIITLFFWFSYFKVLYFNLNLPVPEVCFVFVFLYK